MRFYYIIQFYYVIFAFHYQMTSLGRPKEINFPIICEFCEKTLLNHQQLHYHNKLSKTCIVSPTFTMEKKVRQNEPTLINFSPISGISQNNQKLLQEIKAFISQETKRGIHRRTANLKQYVREGINVFFLEKLHNELNLLKNFLSEKRIEYREKQEQVKVKIDEMLEKCSLIYGEREFSSLLGNPPNYTISLERMLVNHIRQRSIEDLLKSESIVDVISFSVKQMKVFRGVEKDMTENGEIEEMISEYLETSLNQVSSFSKSEGQMVSQDLDDIEGYVLRRTDNVNEDDDTTY